MCGSGDRFRLASGTAVAVVGAGFGAAGATCLCVAIGACLGVVFRVILGVAVGACFGVPVVPALLEGGSGMLIISEEPGGIR